MKLYNWYESKFEQLFYTFEKMREHNVKLYIDTQLEEYPNKSDVGLTQFITSNIFSYIFLNKDNYFT